MLGTLRNSEASCASEVLQLSPLAQARGRDFATAWPSSVVPRRNTVAMLG